MLADGAHRRRRALSGTLRGPLRAAQAYAIGALFIAAGTLHFRYPRAYESIVPPYLPAHRTLVLVSGACEVLGGFGSLPVATRRVAGYGLIALLLAVFPANLFMAADARRFAKLAPAWALYARLPLQFALIAWIYVVSVRRR